MPFQSLRDYLQKVDEHGDLLKIDGADRDEEIGALAETIASTLSDTTSGALERLPNDLHAFDVETQHIERLAEQFAKEISSYAEAREHTIEIAPTGHEHDAQQG